MIFTNTTLKEVGLSFRFTISRIGDRSFWIRWQGSTKCLSNAEVISDYIYFLFYYIYILPPELRTFSLPPPSSLQIIKHHLQHAPLSVTPGFSTRNSSPTSSSSLSLTHLIPFLLTPLLNYPRLNA